MKRIQTTLLFVPLLGALALSGCLALLGDSPHMLRPMEYVKTHKGQGTKHTIPAPYQLSYEAVLDALKKASLNITTAEGAAFGESTQVELAYGVYFYPSQTADKTDVEVLLASPWLNAQQIRDFEKTFIAGVSEQAELRLLRNKGHVASQGGTQVPTVTAPPLSPAPPTPSSVAGKNAEAAKQFVLKKQFDEAIQEGNQAIKLDPNYPFGWYWLGKAHYEKQEYDQAITGFQKVIDLRPTNPQWQWAIAYAESHLGWAYYIKGNYDEAVRRFTLSIEKDSTLEGLFEGRGRAYLAKKEYDAALRDLTKAVESGKFLVRAFYFRGQTHFYKGDFYEALTDFNRGIETQDPYLKEWLPRYLRFKALSYLGMGDPETAATLVKESTEIPEIEKSRLLALIAYASGDKDKALKVAGGRIGVRKMQDSKKGTNKGVLVLDLFEGGPGHDAGLLKGDLIAKINGVEVERADDVRRTVQALPVGTTITLTVVREGRIKELTLKTASAEPHLKAELAEVFPKAMGQPLAAKARPKESDVEIERLPSSSPKPKAHAYAVVIGIETYREKLPKADFAAKDAALVSQYLTKVLGYPEENVVVRLNERATRSDLVKYFDEWLRNNVEPGGSVFVYYSGHGAPNPKTGDAYLVPYDGDPSFVESTGYPIKQLYASLDKLPAKDIVVVLDSCFSGAGGRSVLAKGARPMGLALEHAVSLTGKAMVLAASSGDQISSTYEEKGHGLLTYFFLKGLQGEGDVNKDGAIDLAEIYEYVKPNVQRVARKQYNTEQTPQLLASQDILRRGAVRLIESRNP